MSTVELTGLPAVVTSYLGAHRARETDAALAAFTPDATVTDAGHTYAGPDQIRAWLDKSSTEFSYTIAPVWAEQTGSRRYTVLQHLEGNFPGGTVDLRYRFTLAGRLIRDLVIEP